MSVHSDGNCWPDCCNTCFHLAEDVPEEREATE